ncbi:MAG TPA: nucleotidyltransferase domain-containing protein [Candidatus Saccharimonadia bacterium]|nr:nucleotidyltransferase domain-containing protein [Candidatus Saccharimonadia bacterium]
MPPVLEPYRQQIEALCRRFYVRRMEVFGSALRDDFNPARSDVDFLVEFDTSPDVNAFEAYFDLRQQLGALLSRPVDLVMLSAIRNPYVRACIEAQRELVYAV